MEYQVVVEFDPASRHYTATVAGIPEIVVDARTERTALKMVRDAIGFFLEEQSAQKPPRRRRRTAPIRAKVVTVTV